MTAGASPLRRTRTTDPGTAPDPTEPDLRALARNIHCDEMRTRMIRRRRLAAAIGLTLALAAAGCGQGNGGSGERRKR